MDVSPACKTLSVTLPKTQRPMPERPCVDMAIKSISFASEYSRIRSAGGPESRILEVLSFFSWKISLSGLNVTFVPEVLALPTVTNLDFGLPFHIFDDKPYRFF